MIRSMTGFASKTVTLLQNNTKANVFISIKSLNSRFFETTCKLPYQLNSLEIDLIKLMKDSLFRGHIYYTVYVSNADIFKGEIEPSLTTIEGYLHAIKTIKERHAIEGTLSVADLIQLPNIFSTEEKGVDDKTKQLIFDTTHHLISELIAAEQKEGAALKKDLEQRTQLMTDGIATIEQASATLIENQKVKISATLQEVTQDPNSLAAIQKHAAYMLLEKMDINEEIVRFKSHLKNIHLTLNSPDIEKGKRLDFTFQEMMREINTIAAKCSDATISMLAINIKVELEKAREQIQNVV